MKIFILTGYAPNLINFRADLIKTMQTYDHEVIAAGPESDADNTIKEFLNLRYIQIPFDRTGRGFFKDLFFICNLVKCLKAEKPDVFFGYNVKPVIYGIIAANFAKIKYKYVLITGLGSIFANNDLKTKIMRFIICNLYKISMNLCNRVIFQNIDDCEECLRLKLVTKSKTVIVNGSGVNMNYFEFQRQPNNIVFLMIARMMKEKGVIEFLQASKRISEKYSNVKFQLLGQFLPAPNMLKLNDLKPFLSDNIQYLGETNDVRPYLKDCSILVLPSYYREGVPRVILEAMATGRAIITTDSPGCRETVKHDYNGLLIPVRNVDALANAMLHLIKNPHKISEMGMNSLKYCQEKFEVTKINKNMLHYMQLER